MRRNGRRIIDHKRQILKYNRKGVNIMRMVKCPQCEGKGEYNLIQGGIETPVKCNCDNGKITWSHYLTINRKKTKKGV